MQRHGDARPREQGPPIGRRLCSPCYGAGVRRPALKQQCGLRRVAEAQRVGRARERQAGAPLHAAFARSERALGVLYCHHMSRGGMPCTIPSHQPMEEVSFTHCSRQPLPCQLEQTSAARTVWWPFLPFMSVTKLHQTHRCNRRSWSTSSSPLRLMELNDGCRRERGAKQARTSSSRMLNVQPPNCCAVTASTSRSRREAAGAASATPPPPPCACRRSLCASLSARRTATYVTVCDISGTLAVSLGDPLMQLSWMPGATRNMQGLLTLPVIQEFWCGTKRASRSAYKHKSS